MKTMPFNKYRPYAPVRISSRRWPDRVIVQAPAWCSVDLRDGNQALSTPMGITEKMEMFRLLVAIGFREIEIGFPSAAEVEFEFARQLIEGRHIPEDVTIQVLVQARAPLIRRTFEAVRGARDVIVHLYNSTSEAQRRIVFGKDRGGIIAIAREAAELMEALRHGPGMEGVRFEYTPESFHGTELDMAVDICQAVLEVWTPSPERKVIINLPSTVEACTPNVYADRIEWFGDHVRGRENIILSVHTHNDRGGAVASAELAVMAGAERVEGALFGNGERTGNMDIITMAMNLFSQGVDPRLDLSDIDHIREVYSRCTRMTVHERHPYAGDLVFTAFSGSHQDAINKGLKAREKAPESVWEVPYLPIDPHDVGRDYEAVIRINSQSGKGGVAYILERDGGYRVPKAMQPVVAAEVQRLAEKSGRELSSDEIRACFEAEFIEQSGRYCLERCCVQDQAEGSTLVDAVVGASEGRKVWRGSGNGPVSAFVNAVRDALSVTIDVVLFEEHALTTGAEARAVAYIGLSDGQGQQAYGVGIDENISTASIKAVLMAMNRLRPWS